MSRLTKLERLLTKGKITRREFITRVSALGLTAALTPALLTTPARASIPKKGGRFRMGMGGGAMSDSLDSATINEVIVYNLNWQIRNNLVEIDYKGNPIPELAESWESTPDAAKWIFKLRKGVQFHNGKTLDAEDVIYSINHHRGKDSKSAAKGVVEPIKDIKADGKHEVVFTLSGGNADFPFVLSDYHLTIVPAGTSGAEWEKGIGTGGYILQDFEPGVRSLTKNNPNYFKSGRAHFDEVEILNIADTNSRTSALKTKRIDYMQRAELKTVDLLRNAPDIQIIRTTGSWHYTMPMFTDVAPFDNNDVRLALKYAVDREQLLKIVLRGYGSVGNDHPIGPNQRFFASELPQRIYDPDKAKFHLKKAGIADYTFKLRVCQTLAFIDIATIYKENAAEAGINIEIVKEPADGYYNEVWMKKPWTMTWWSGRPSEDWMFSLTYAADADWNDTHWKHKRFNELLLKARAELDKGKRRDMYVEMQGICSNEGGTVIPLFKDIVEAANTKVKYSNLASDTECDGGKNAERWWFEA